MTRSVSESSPPLPAMRNALLRRYLAVWFPWLPVERIHGAAAHAVPAVLVTKQKGALVIAAFNRPALQAGLMEGQTLADARARLAQIDVGWLDAGADEQAVMAIALGCERFTPLVMLDPPHGLVMDITGCAHLWGGETAMLVAVQSHLSRSSLSVKCAIAGTPQAARTIARFGDGGVVESDNLSCLLDRLPVGALECDGAISAALRRAGLYRLGDLATRSRAALAARFGSDFVERLDAVYGRLNSRITPLRPPPAIMVERLFTEPVSSADFLAAALADMLENACARLQERGQGGREFCLHVFTSDGKHKAVEVATSEPNRDSLSLQRLYALKMGALADMLGNGAGFDMLRLDVICVGAICEDQRDLSGQASERDAHRAVHGLIDRLVARFGAHHVLALAENDTHWPDYSVCRAPIALLQAERRSAAPSLPALSPPRRPLTLFDPPQPIEAMAEVPDSPPLRFRWRGILHQVRLADGPERIEPEWWHEGEAALPRDYYRVENTSGQRFWLFRSGFYGTHCPKWFMHGLFA